ncbi:MAG: hypothetical protein AAF441_26245 [Pseudomonadota bacterium]
MAEQKGRGSGRRRRTTKAPVLELDASEVTEETDAELESEAVEPGGSEFTTSPQSTNGTETPARQPGGWILKAAAIAAVFVAGTAAGAWLYRDLAANYAPAADITRQTDQLKTLADRVTAMEAKSATASSALDRLNSENDVLRKEFATATQSPDLGKALDTAEAARKSAEKAEADASEASGQVKAALEQAEAALDAANTVKSEVEQAKSSISELKSALEAAAAAVPAGDEAVGEAMQAVQAKLSALALNVAELQRKAAEQQTAPRTDEKTAARVAELTKRVETLRSDVKAAHELGGSLQSSLAELQSQFSAAQDAARLTEAQSELAKALADLRTAVANGRQFVGPVEAIRTRYPDSGALQVLTSHATSGVATKTALTSELSEVRKKLSANLIAPPEAAADERQPSSSILTTLQDRLSAIVKVRPAGTRDWSALVAQMEAQAKKGNLAEAVNLADSAGEAPPDALAAWLKPARVRVAVDKALAAVSATAMADLAGTRGTGG